LQTLVLIEDIVCCVGISPFSHQWRRWTVFPLWSKNNSVYEKCTSLYCPPCGRGLWREIREALHK